MAELYTSKSGYSHISKPDEPIRVPKKTSFCLLSTAAFILLASGSFDSLIAKFMNRQKLPTCEGCPIQNFEAPFFQSWTMYIAEAMMLLVAYIDIWFAKRRHRTEILEMRVTIQSFHKPPCPFYLWCIPAFLDFTSSVMVNWGFILAHVSTVQLLRNFNVVVTALLSLFLIKVALRWHQILGVFVVTIGLILTGVAAFLNPESSNNYEGLGYLGIIFAIVGTIVNAFQFVFEEYLFRTYYASPYQALGYIGVFGLIISSLVLVILEFIPFNLERTSKTFYQMSLAETGSIHLIWSNISFVISCALFNGSGMVITKVGSGLLRTIVISARTITVWIFELIFSWNTFHVLSLFGLIITLFGVVVYNYNYILQPSEKKLDTIMRSGVMCFPFLVDPNVIEEQEEAARRKLAEIIQNQKDAAANKESIPIKTEPLYQTPATAIV